MHSDLQHRWRYIIQGGEICMLKRPFDIDGVKVSKKNYGQGVMRYAYFDEAHEAEIRRRKLLECARGMFRDPADQRIEGLT